MAEFEVIPQEAIDSLLANPEKAGGFDAVFGQGRAAEVLASRDPAPEPTRPQNSEMGFLEKVWDSTGRAIGYGIQEAANETADAVESFDRWASYKLDEIGIPSRLQLKDEEGNLTFQLRFTHEVDMDAPSYGDYDIEMVQQPETVVGGVVSGISQFAAGFIGAGKFTKLAGLRGAFVNGAITDALVFDPNDKNVMGMLEQFGVDTGQLGEILATDPDDPEYFNRLRNAAEGAVIGGVVEAIGWVIRSVRAARAGDEAAAAAARAKMDEALRPLDEALQEGAENLRADLDETFSTAKQMFGDSLDMEPDGQLRMDLGDTPTPRVETPTAPHPDRIYLTPQKVERIRYEGALSRDIPLAQRLQDFSWRSTTTMSDYSEVADEITGVASVLRDEIMKAKGGDVQSLRTVRLQAAAAQRRLVAEARDPEALINTLRTTYSGDPDGLAAEVLARESFVRNLGQNITELSRMISTGTIDTAKFGHIRNIDQARIELNAQLEIYANALAGNNANRANIGRAMRAMQEARKGSERIQALLADPAAFRDIDAVARAIADPANAGSPIVKTMDTTLNAIHGFMDRVNSFRINALLSGPGTQEVNFISNVVNSFVIPTEQFLGGLASGDRAMMVHALRQFQGYFLGLMDSVKAARHAGWWNEAVLDAHSMKVEDDALLKGITGIKSVDNVLTLPSRGLMTMDELFKQSQYRGRIFADANLEAARKGLRGEEKTAFVKQYIADSFDEAGMALREDALLQARRATFTEPLEPGLASWIQQAAIQHPTIRFFVPFVRTPINILSQTFQHAPVIGLISRRMRADIAAGGARAAQAYGRQVIGTALVGMAGWAAANGFITGSGPSDPRIRAVWLKNNQPYAFRIPQEDGTVRWVSYARLEPLSNVFSIAADTVEIMSDEYNESEKTILIRSLAMAVMENTVNKTFTQGIYDAMSLFVGRPHEQERATRNFVASFVPNMLNQTNGDEALREARNLTDAVLARTGFYNGVDPKRNVLGEVITRPLPKYDPLGLTVADVREIDPVMKEITRAAIDNQSVAGNPSKRLQGPNRINLTEIRYEGNPNQTLYDRWLELTGTVEIGGKTLREQLTETIQSRAYLTAPEGDVQLATSGTKGSIIRRIISSYREAAKAELPQLQELIRAERMGTADMLLEQNRRNRELFPSVFNPTNPTQSIRSRSFEELFGSN
jgi:hypothetical protein